jgi:hypothetical protein
MFFVEEIAGSSVEGIKTFGYPRKILKTAEKI